MSTLFESLEQDEESRGKLDGETAELAKLWDAARRDDEIPDTTAAWRKLEARIEASETPRFSFFHSWSSRFVLAGALAALLLFFLWPRDPGMFTAPPGQRRIVVLGDGSRVELNAGSTLSLHSGFGEGNRMVSLVGEAWFDVEKGDQPFVVEAELGKVTVLGTHFNVLARGQALDVGVNEGRVEVSAGEGSVVLTAGQMIRFSKGGELGLPSEIGGDNFPPWRNQMLLCDRTPLEEVTGEIGRRFAIQIEIHDAQLAQYSVDGLLDARDPETALDALALLIGRNYHLRNGIYLFE